MVTKYVRLWNSNFEEIRKIHRTISDGLERIWFAIDEIKRKQKKIPFHRAQTEYHTMTMIIILFLGFVGYYRFITIGVCLQLSNVNSVRRTRFGFCKKN